MNERSRPSTSIVSHVLMMAERGHRDFDVRQCDGFGENAIRRFGSMPCVIHLQLLPSSVPETSRLDKMADMPGLKEACNLASKIRASPIPLRIPRPSVAKMPPLDRVCYQNDRRAWLRAQIRIDGYYNVLKIRNKIYGFKSAPCSHLKNSIIFPEIKKIAERWDFDTRGTILE